MKKRFSTSISVLLAALLVVFPIDLSAFSTADTYLNSIYGSQTVFAEEEEEPLFSLSVPDISASPGDLVKIEVQVQGNIGFTSAVLMLDTGSGSPILPVLGGATPLFQTAITEPLLSWQSHMTNGICYYYTMMSQYYEGNGTLFSAYFRVADDARAGSYPVQLSCKKLRNGSEDLTVELISGSVTVGDPQETTMPTMLTTTTAETTTETTTTTIMTDSKPEPYRYGIDVSRWQGEVDWTKVKKSGKVDFAIMRAGYGKEYDQVDPTFHTNMKNAQAAGIPCGAYWYSYAASAADAKQEAKVFLDTIKGYSFEYPVVFDIEDPSQSTLSPSVIAEIIDTFCGAVEAEGYYCVLYSYASFFNSHIPDSTEKKYDIWVAHTQTTKPDYTGNYGIWQYSHTGAVSGISGDVDMNYAYRDYPAIIKNGNFNGFKGE